MYSRKTVLIQEQHFTLYKQLENFTVDQLVSLLRCNLPGNSSRSIMLWKMLLTKLSGILDPALDVLAAVVSVSVI